MVGDGGADPVDLTMLQGPPLQILFVSLGLVLISFVLGFFARLYIERKIKERAEGEAERILEEARRDAETIKKEARWKGKEEIEQRKQDVKQELASQREELQAREEELHRKEEMVEERLEEVYEEIDELKEKRDRLDRREEQIQQNLKETERELERISGLTSEEAEAKLRETLIEKAKKRANEQIRKVESQARDEAEARVRRVLARALQRCAVDQTTESTVQVVDLPSDDMKGRIIGRDGRNIRAFEKVTGVDLIVDDTPEAVLISCFNPVRREVARATLEKLILDGRIQPARIEEVFEKTRDELEESIRESGKEALSEVGVTGIHDELVRRLGQLKYVIEAGQNQLEHSIQVAHLAGLLAAELGADTDMAKQCGILHAIGKTVDHNNGQSYATAGASLAEKYGVAEPAVYAIASHTGERPFKTVEGIITHVAHLISRERPGARKDKFESFIQRMETIEDLANQFTGVKETYAIEAGEEIRVIVEEDVVDDREAEILARDVANRIQDEIDFPEKIKVSLLREKRVIDFAR